MASADQDNHVRATPPPRHCTLCRPSLIHRPRERPRVSLDAVGHPMSPTTRPCLSVRSGPRSHPPSIKRHLASPTGKRHQRALGRSVQACANPRPVPQRPPRNLLSPPPHLPVGTSLREASRPGSLIRRAKVSPTSRYPTHRPRTLRSPLRPRHRRSPRPECR